MRITASTAQIDGAIRADGGHDMYGDSGGILPRVGTLSGDGTLTANGGDGLDAWGETYWLGCGGGGFQFGDPGP